jgi:steroid delta-isomerase-like uncharacterized protein
MFESPCLFNFDPQQKIKEMKNEQNIKNFREWIKLHQEHDVPGMLNYLTENVSIRSAAGGKMPPATNKEEAAHHWDTIYGTFPDFRMEELSITSEDEVIVAEISHGGTMTGPMGPFEANGASYRVHGAFRFDFDNNGKIKSIVSYWDPSSMLMQLGLIQEPAEA